MGTLRAKLVDRNRLAKRYPLIRAPARFSYLGDANMAIEVGSVFFNNTDTGTLTYDVSFPDEAYQVVATTREYGNAEAPNVNIFITGKTRNSVTLNASAAFTGYVDVFAVRIG